jgi:hypothetical protein
MTMQPNLVGESKRIYYKFERSLYMRRILSTKNLTLPDFMGIGLERSGTTWLYSQLRCHPNLYLPTKKELHYFDTDMELSLRVYAESFKAGRDKFKGEITPLYAFIPLWRIQYIHLLMPHLKLILMFRDPVERAWSRVRYKYARENPMLDPTNVPEARIYEYFRGSRDVSRSDFVTALDNWSNVFSPQQIYVGFYDDIVARPRELLTDIFSFLGVPQPTDWSTFPLDEIVNPSPAAPMPIKYREFLEELYRPHYSRLYERFGERIRSDFGKLSSRVG